MSKRDIKTTLLNAAIMVQLHAKVICRLCYSSRYSIHEYITNSIHTDTNFLGTRINDAHYGDYCIFKPIKIVFLRIMRHGT